MKNLLLILLLIPCLTFAQKQKEGVTYDAVITRVIDGDTVAFQAPFLPAPPPPAPPQPPVPDNPPPPPPPRKTILPVIREL
jgi:hypothetical protein